MNKEIYYPEPTGSYKSIREWSEDERPRERLIKHGANTLSNAELLAILISSGTKGFSALDAAKSLLEEFQSLSNLSSCDFSHFKKIKGVGNAKAVTLSAAFELGKRIEIQSFSQKPAIHSPEDIANLYIPRLRDLKKETFHTILLNSANQIIRDVQISEGILNASIVHPREVFRIAITESAASIILMHNHPSGSLEPSRDDIAITKQLVDVGKLIDIKVLDHVIIAGNSFTSLSKLGIVVF